MKAVIWKKYGSPDGLQLGEIQKPTPKDNQLLVKVYAATVTAGDCEVRSLKVPVLIRLPMRLYIGLQKPQRITILGQEFSGKVEAVGKDVARFKVGDQVFGTTGFNMGAYAEYVCLPETGVFLKKPTSLTYEEAAGVPVGGLEALHFLRQAHLQVGEKVLINGAGGSIGTIGVQLAKSWGAEVTAVDSTEKLDMLRTIGADHVIDYIQEDFTKRGEKYDVIFDVVGKSSFSRSINALKDYGRYLQANPGLSHLVQAPWVSRSSGKKVIMGTSNPKVEDLQTLTKLIEAGQIKPIIDRSYPLEKTAEAHRYVETGAKKGNVIITVADDQD